jgi:hypothetical protein
MQQLGNVVQEGGNAKSTKQNAADMVCQCWRMQGCAARVEEGVQCLGSACVPRDSRASASSEQHVHPCCTFHEFTPT